MITVFMALFFLITLYYVKRSGYLNQIGWDADTITAGDYTVEYEIDPEAFQKWFDDIFSGPDGDKGRIPLAYSFKSYLKEQFEKILNELL